MIAIDWGTTSFRAYRLDPAGRIVDSRSAPAGIFDQLGAGRHTVCLPGTHSKWVEVENGKIMHFSTHMTGEAFAVSKAHSFLGRMTKDGATNRNAFADGVRRSADAGGMLHHLFGVRSRGLFGELPDTASASYPSGSSATRFMPPVSAGSPCTCCAPQLADVYVQALDALGLESSTLDSNAVTHGLFRLASHLKK
jgi:2-dehydro-3-deoxygalactonokinase